MDIDLLTSPLFIIKKLQRDAFLAHADRLTGRVLDIGCGTQPFRRYITASDYIGMDESKNVTPELCASVISIPFKDGQFDTVLCAEVLEHIARPADALTQIARILKPGGRLYVTAPQSWGLHYEPCDYWRFTKYGLERLLADQGLSVISVMRIGGIFTLIGQEAVDVLAAVLKKGFSFLGDAWAERLSTGLCLPLSLFFYCLGKIGDRIDTRYALGWAIVAVKR